MGKIEVECDCNIIHEDHVKQAKDKMLKEDVLLLIANFYKAMADGTRIKIINILKENELCVCDIAVVLNMTKSAVSHQLKYLRRMNLIKSRKTGKEVFYTLSDNHVNKVFDISLEHVMESENED